MKANGVHIELHIGSFHVGIDESEHDAYTVRSSGKSLLLYTTPNPIEVAQKRSPFFVLNSM